MGKCLLFLVPVWRSNALQHGLHVFGQRRVGQKVVLADIDIGSGFSLGGRRRALGNLFSPFRCGDNARPIRIADHQPHARIVRYDVGGYSARLVDVMDACCRLYVLAHQVQSVGGQFHGVEC